MSVPVGDIASDAYPSKGHVPAVQLRDGRSRSGAVVLLLWLGVLSEVDARPGFLNDKDARVFHDMEVLALGRLVRDAEEP